MIINLDRLKETVERLLNLIKEMPELGSDGEEENFQNEAEIRDTLITELHDGLKVLWEKIKAIEGGW